MSRALRDVVYILQKDILIEWRARSRAFALACFAVTILLLFSFAIGPDTAALQQHAGAYLWLALLLSSTLLLSRSFQIEVESGALETLILAPVAPAALFYGKAIANAAQLVLLGLASLPFVVALFEGRFAMGAPALLPVLVLGAMGLAAPGTLYAALTARLHARQLLLPLLLFPLIVPCLLASVKATSLVMAGDPMEQMGSWLTLLLCFDLVYWSLCGVLFPRVIEA